MSPNTCSLLRLPLLGVLPQQGCWRDQLGFEVLVTGGRMLGQWRTSEWWISGCVGEGRQSGKGGGLLMDEPLRLRDLPESSSLELSPHLQSSVLTLHFSFSHAEGISSTRGHSFPHPGRAHTSQGTLYSGPVAFKGGISSLGSVSVTVGGGACSWPPAKAIHKGNSGSHSWCPKLYFSLERKQWHTGLCLTAEPDLPTGHKL